MKTPGTGWAERGAVSGAGCMQSSAASIGAAAPKRQAAGRALLWRIAALLVAGGLTACAPPPLRPPEATPAAAQPAAPAAALAAAEGDEPAALVEAERNAAAARDLATLAALWAEDAQITEWRGAAAADAYRWQGRTAILDRYRVAVFPAPPPPLAAPLGLTAQVSGAAEGAAEGVTARLVNGVDTWEFARRDGRWWITALTIGAP